MHNLQKTIAIILTWPSREMQQSFLRSYCLCNLETSIYTAYTLHMPEYQKNDNKAELEVTIYGAMLCYS